MKLRPKLKNWWIRVKSIFFKPMKKLTPEDLYEADPKDILYSTDLMDLLVDEVYTCRPKLGLKPTQFPSLYVYDHTIYPDQANIFLLGYDRMTIYRDYSKKPTGYKFGITGAKDLTDPDNIYMVFYPSQSASSDESVDTQQLNLIEKYLLFTIKEILKITSKQSFYSRCKQNEKDIIATLTTWSKKHEKI